MDIQKYVKKIRVTKKIVGYAFDAGLDALMYYIEIIVQHFGLFSGMVLIVFGLMGFESDKYCDGNAADYLSCTRPTTYYYYDSLEKVFVVIGIVLLLLWFLKKSHK